MNCRLVSKSVTLNDFERRNDPYFTEFAYDVVVKTIIKPTLVSKSTFDVYDHINTICAIIQRLFGQNKFS